MTCTSHEDKSWKNQSTSIPLYSTGLGKLDGPTDKKLLESFRYKSTELVRPILSLFSLLLLRWQRSAGQSNDAHQDLRRVVSTAESCPFPGKRSWCYGRTYQYQHIILTLPRCNYTTAKPSSKGKRPQQFKVIFITWCLHSEVGYPVSVLRYSGSKRVPCCFCHLNV